MRAIRGVRRTRVYNLRVARHHTYAVGKNRVLVHNAKCRWTIKGRVKRAGLPTKGKVRYVPPKNYNPATPLATWTEPWAN